MYSFQLKRVDSFTATVIVNPYTDLRPVWYGLSPRCLPGLEEPWGRRQACGQRWAEARASRLSRLALPL